MKTKKRARRKGRNETIPYDWQNIGASARAWLAAGCPARFDVRTVVNLQPATSEPATGGQ